MCSNSETKPFYGHFTFIALPLFVVFLFVSPSSSREAPHKGCQLHVVMHITPASYSRLCKVQTVPNCSVAVVRPANVMINIFTRTSSPSICPNCSLSKCISSCVVGADAISISDSNIHHQYPAAASPWCLYLSISASVPGQGWCLTAWCRNGRGSSQWEGEDGGNQTINGPSPSPGQPRPGLLIVTLCLMCLVSHINTNTTII